MIKTYPESVHSMYKGIKRVNDVVKTTLGPYGSNVAIMRDDVAGAPLITDDGVRVIEFCLENLTGEELIGGKLLYESSKRTEDTVGDGTTTTYLLASDMIKNHVSSLSEDSVFDKSLNRKLKVDLKSVSEEVIEKLKQYKEVVDLEKIYKIAESSSGSKSIGKVVGDLRSTVGLDGVISVQYSRDSKDRIEYSKGYELSGGFPHKVFYTAESNKLELSNPLVMVVKKVIQLREDFQCIYSTYSSYIKAHPDRANSPLVVFCEKFTGECMSLLLHNWFNRADNIPLPVFPIEVPVIDLTNDSMEDIALLSGINVVVTDGLLKGEVLIDNIGSLETVSSNSKLTTIVSNNSDSLDLAVANEIGHLQGILDTLNDSNDTSEINRLKRRISNLKGKAAVVHVGGATDSERTERKLKFDDSILATRSAVSDGVLLGAGISQLLASNLCYSLVSTDNKTISRNLAIDLLGSSLISIVKTLWINCGVSEEVIDNYITTYLGMDIDKILSKDNVEEISKMIGVDSESYDPYMILEESIRNSVSVVSQFISTESTILLQPNE